MGTGSGRAIQDLGDFAAWPVPVPIFSHKAEGSVLKRPGHGAPAQRGGYTEPRDGGTHHERLTRRSAPAGTPLVIAARRPCHPAEPGHGVHSVPVEA